MSLNVSTLRPGLLVSLKTSIVGNVKYDKLILEAEHAVEDGSRRARWETERTINDPAEHAAAQEVRSKASHAVRRVCSYSAFGLLCPEDKAAELEAAIAEARTLANDFNATAKLTELHVYIMAGRVAPDDVEAVRAINSEVRDLLADMQEGLSNVDVKAVRAAANRAKSLGQMLAPDAAVRIQIAVDAARESARKIVKAGEETAQEIDLQTIKRIAEQRTAFLDLDDATEIARPASEGRAIDLAPTMQ